MYQIFIEFYESNKPSISPNGNAAGRLHVLAMSICLPAALDFSKDSITSTT
jgi:hypothetical protein